MNTTELIMTAVLVLTLSAPVLSIYAVRFAVRKDFETHKKWQTWIYAVSILGVLVLEGLIRVSGGSGSLSGQSPHAETTLFKTILTAHIIGAVLTYILWTYLIFASRKKFKNTLPGNFSKTHRVLGKTVLFGLIYTGLTALVVYLMTLGFV